MRGAITNKIGTSEVKNCLPFLRPKEAGHSPALKEEDKHYDWQDDVREFWENRSSELPHFQTASLFIFSLFSPVVRGTLAIS
jgi:hypothetical protein